MSIDIINVQKRFGDFVALDNINLTIEPGELVALLGPSGCGKTTLLRIIAGLETADSGNIAFSGEDATHLHVRDRQVGFVFQHYALFRHMSVFENVAFGLRVRPRETRPPEEAIRRKVTELLKLVQLDWLADRRPSQLSGGQRQRIAIARALLTNPRILIFDEATSALDYESEHIIQKNMRAICQNRTVIIIAHRLSAVRQSNRILVMERGQIIEAGHHDMLMQRENGAYRRLYNLQQG